MADEDLPEETSGKDYPPILVSQQELSARLGLTTRWIYDLTKDGVFTKLDGKYGQYDLDASHKAYTVYKLAKEAEKRAPSVTDGLTLRKEQLLKQRLDREARVLINIDEALAVVDIVTGHFLEVISGLPARVTRNIAERKRIEAITDAVRTKLAGIFGAEREALRSGVPVGEAVDEDDA